jgi:hypothetical protein
VKPLLLRCAAALVALALAACARGESHVPAGVVAPAASPGALVDGIYTSRPGDQTCCWVARDTAFQVRKNGDATDFALEFYIPDLRTFRARPQGFTVTFEGRYRVERCCFGPGLHTVLFPVPRELRDRTGLITVRVQSRRTVVYAREGAGPDERELAFVFVSADFRSFLRGRF